MARKKPNKEAAKATKNTKDAPNKEQDNKVIDELEEVTPAPKKPPPKKQTAAAAKKKVGKKR